MEIFTERFSPSLKSPNLQREEREEGGAREEEERGKGREGREEEGEGKRRDTGNKEGEWGEGRGRTKPTQARNKAILQYIKTHINT